MHIRQSTKDKFNSILKDCNYYILSRIFRTFLVLAKDKILRLINLIPWKQKKTISKG